MKISNKLGLYNSGCYDAVNSMIHSVSLASHVSTHLLRSSIYHHYHSHHPSQSFTLSIQAQNLPIRQILPTLDFFTYWAAFMIMGLDPTYHAHHFIFSFSF